MTNRAQILQPLQVDIFTVIPAGILVTFTDENSQPGYYTVTPDPGQAPALNGRPALIDQNLFDKLTRYYKQATLF